MDNRFKDIVDELKNKRIISEEDLAHVLELEGEDNREYLFEAARTVADQVFHKEIYLRGLIEFTNYCKNNCYYCGIRCGNQNAERYRLSEEEILSCCEIGEKIGFKTFVLQGGEDPYFTDDRICELVRKIKAAHPSCAVTLSIGEKSYESYKKYYDAGADRYLLRHETANEEHYSMLHPESMSGAARKQCLFDLKDIGFQVGCGIMVGTPHQTMKHIYEDIVFTLVDIRCRSTTEGHIGQHGHQLCIFQHGVTEQKTLLIGSKVFIACHSPIVVAVEALESLVIGREDSYRTRSVQHIRLPQIIDEADIVVERPFQSRCFRILQRRVDRTIEETGVIARFIKVVIILTRCESTTDNSQEQAI